MTSCSRCSLYPDRHNRKSRRRLLFIEVIFGALLVFGGCEKNRDDGAKASPPKAPAGSVTTNAAAPRAVPPITRIKFNGGYGTAPAPDALGVTGGSPIFAKGHTWITKKAMEYLSKRRLLPPVLASKRYQNYLYYGTSFADWPWMGRPEAPNVPVWNPMVKSLDAVQDLTTSQTCPYSATSCGYVPPAAIFTPAGLQQAVGTIAGANCANLQTTPCADPGSSPMISGYDHSYNCLRVESSQSCMKVSDLGWFHKENVEPTGTWDMWTANLDMDVAAIVGLGNAYQRDHMLSIRRFPLPLDPGASLDYKILENNLPMHTNPAMLFRLTLNLGGDDGDWSLISSDANLQWMDPPIVQDFALDNLFHYALSDILQYDSSVLNSWGQPHDPTTADATIMACNDLVNAHSENRFFGAIASYEQCILNLSPYATSVLGYPFLNHDFSPGGHPDLMQEGLYQLQFQPVMGRTGYGAPKYGSILYQLARKFFKGSPSQPTTSDLVFAGNDVSGAPGWPLGWHTGGSFGAVSTIGGADFTNVQLPFPHTYLGGNPFICSGGSSPADSCADGSASWPIWVPETYDASDQNGSLANLTATSPNRWNGAALAYLGWASHLIQDLALPHHASNWSGKQHAAQDSYGDYFADADALHAAMAAGQYPPIVQNPDEPCHNGYVSDLYSIHQYPYCKDCPPGPITTVLNSFDQAMDSLVTQMIGRSGTVSWTSDQIASFCAANGLPREGIVDGSINWNAVYGAFLGQAQTAFASRKPLTPSDGCASVLSDPYTLGIMQNAILATMKLIICAAPYDEQLPAPENVRAAPIDRGVDLAWDPVPGAVGYVVYVSSPDAPDYTVLGQVTDPIVGTRSLTNGTTYSFYVVAKDANDVDGAPSAVVSAVPQSAVGGCQSAPQLWVETADGSAILYWTPMYGTAAYYHVFMTDDQGHNVDLGYSVAPTFTVSITPYSTHFFWVQGLNTDCTTPISNLVGTSWGGRLSAPQNFKVTQVNHGADLYWDPVDGAAGYVVFMAIGNSTVFAELTSLTGQNSTGFTVDGLVNGKEYSFFVAATYADGGLGDRSNTLSTYANSGPQPNATQLWVHPADGQMRLEWVGVPSAAYYNVWMKTDPNADYTSVACWTRKTTCTVTGLANGTTYYFAVEGANSEFASGNPLSNTVAASPGMAVLMDPMRVRATPVTSAIGNGNIDLTWDPVSGAARYVLYQNLATSPSEYEPVGFVGPAPANQTNFVTFGSMTFGTTYRFGVAALDANSVEGYLYWPVAVTAAQSPALVAPQVAAGGGDGQVTLTWTEVPGASVYWVWMKTDGNADFSNDDVWQTWTLETAHTMNVFDGLSNGTTYYFWVQAGNSASMGSFGHTVPVSAVVSATPQPRCPGEPPCSGQGTCNAGVCTCTPGSGYSGTDCSVTCPGGPTCSGHGTCNAGVCACTPGSGYSGADCSVTCPGGPACSGHGTCSAGVCACTPGSGYSGADCSVTCPGGPTCSGHGTCNAGTCSCSAGYSGGDCSVTCPNGPTCSGHGTCNAGVCTCTAGSGYSGADCSVTCPGGPTCSGHGTCNAGTCSCAAGYSGASCSVTCPGGPTCSSHGTCNAGTCSCSGGYSGADCSVTCPGGPTCSGHGTCNAGTCTCAVGYTGTNCATNCGAGSTCPDGTACTGNSQCATRSCVGGICKALSCAPNCTRGTACGASGDCGSRVCTNGTCQAPSCSPNCTQGGACGANADCGSRICSSTSSTCQPSSCAPHCNQGTSCGANTDCGSGVCTSSQCQAPSCSPLCATGAHCGANRDCSSRVCANNVCVAPSCSPRCVEASSCGSNGDCLSRVCTSGICQKPACSPKCAKGLACGNNADCTSRICNNGTCS